MRSLIHHPLIEARASLLQSEHPLSSSYLARVNQRKEQRKHALQAHHPPDPLLQQLRPSRIVYEGTIYKNIRHLQSHHVVFQVFTLLTTPAIGEGLGLSKDQGNG
jgi:hypothetical protein